MRKIIFVAVALAGLSVVLAAGELIEGVYLAGWEKSLTSTAVGGLKELVDLGVEWVGIQIPCREGRGSPKLEEVRGLVRAAKAIGMKVLLVPRLGQRNSSVDFGTDEAAWATWFRSYEELLLPYVELAQEEGVEIFCVGREFGGTVRLRKEWTRLIRDVRAIYKGSLVYAAGWRGEMWDVSFWDLVDYIGINAYYSLTGRFAPTLEELIASWKGPLNSLGCLARREGKRVIFTELGYRSVNGASRAPWDHGATGDPDPNEQALCYRAFFEAVWGKEAWFAGAFLWYWGPEGGPEDTGYTPKGKPAEEILREFFGS
jgi:hypothetical protein